jgi:hypothetical protein
MHPQSITLPFEEEMFWRHVNFDGPLPEHHPELGACWLWTASTNNWGYGEVGRTVQGAFKLHKAHRYAYEHTYGPLPDGKLACHHCDRPACVNPSHMFPGTHQMNSDDKYAKDRASHEGHSYGDDHWTHRKPGTSPIIGTKGEANPGAKLTDDAVREIRRRYAAGDVSQTALAKEYGVSQTVIFHLLKRNTWKHVEDGPDMPPAQPRQVTNRKGELCGHAKLTEDDVRAIRARYAAGGISMSALGREYGISAPSVCLIVKRKTWAHVL